MTLTEESRSIVELMDRRNHFLLSDVSWGSYNAILDELEAAGRRLRHTYDRGRLEIMARGSKHEVYKTLLHHLIVLLAEKLGMRMYMGGETTLQRIKKRRGIEPDQCYWIQSERRVRGKLKIDTRTDPPPDLFVEIEVSRTILDRVKVLAALGVREVWCFNGESLRVGLLQPNGKYQWTDRSPTFRKVPIGELARFLKKAATTDHLSIIREFRKWVEEGCKE